jgi:D-threo-aldose 1-dehydrogenase
MQVSHAGSGHAPNGTRFPSPQFSAMKQEIKEQGRRAMALPKRTLGRSGIETTVLGFGSAPLGDLYEKLDDAAAIATVEEAYRDGITLFDTSPHYGNGLAEHRFGTAFRRMPRENIVVSTKVGRVMEGRASAPKASLRTDVISPGFAGGLPHQARFDYSYDGAMRSFEHSLLRLGLDRIDILLIHDCDIWTHGDEADQRFREAMDGAYKALVKLREEGTVRAIGCGINEAEMCARFAKAGDFDVMMMAGRYSLLEQDSLHTFLPIALEKNIGVMLAGVFNSGILATGAVPGAKYNYRDAPPEIMDKVRRMEKVCAAHGVSIREAAMQFPLGHPAVSAMVLGGVRPEEVRANVASFAVPVPAELWADLRREGLLASDVPTP